MFENYRKKLLCIKYNINYKKNQEVKPKQISDFCGVESSNQIPDGDTLGRFRNLLVKNELQEKLFAQVVEQLTSRGLILKRER